MALVSDSCCTTILRQMRGPTQPIATTCACTAVRRANRAVTQLYDLALAPIGMRATQFSMLQVIAEYGEIAQCEFARKYSISVETLSRRFSWLRLRGLVAIRLGKHSERIYRVTDLGQAAIENARFRWENVGDRLRQELGSDDWEMFLAISRTGACAAHRAEQLKLCNGRTTHGNEQPEELAADKRRAA